ncbi:hypothetical protein EOS93_25090 [Rhizobium sp. RMa-01]|uniref:hypothetical protein n=1 Tax=unclassified Rhizobium TaxID=2613769 RepID=UPI0008DAB629|nr:MULTISPECIES: hypothetical protein [unclassified Rhizobium]OHV24961.1 hypothetical protein BBJ66_22745 [Rhizobium sp. RSm-3]RVU08331.1 hypothetical protein EOS93_25090 [Rhizobium sp. RMa-01]
MDRPPLSMLAQSQMLDDLVGRSIMHGGDAAGEVLLVINRETVDDLVHLSSRLLRMSLFEERIRNIVMGKK